MKEPITTEQLKEVYGRSQQYYQDGSLESLKKEKQHLEGLIFSWRMKLKEKCEEKASKLNQTSAWHQHDDEEFRIIKEACFTPLKDFDEHFSIITKRQGQV